ncbi:MAG TPA: carbamoyltransferase HypF [Blastocatellia bacterium]|nr:carbamoyltransferase HypF [Blastocatellia bacterium]
MTTRVQILVRGVVQGVGFRPYIFSLARRRALRGQVVNNAAGVLIDVEGETTAVEQFINEIELGPPPLSRIESVERRDNLAPADYPEFRIAESESAGRKSVHIAADIGVCADCLRELFDSRDRRYRYPFINCVNCGPRFTIIEDVPYDRAKTTMREFVMCNECRAEYENPFDRRFHAEPTACAVCGPWLYLTDGNGRELETGDGAITRSRRLLLNGKILAVKGVGGFHLACDATNAEAVGRLRRKKYREDKPFALMAGSIEAIEEHCSVSTFERDLLLSERRPVVLLARRPGSSLSSRSSAVAPGLNSLGFMLPYAPLHYLLLENLDRPLVMTSGNVSDEPICHEDRDALERLSKIADHFLLHDRRIHVRADDSVVCARGNKELILRRARGYAPHALKTPFKFEREILACGAELKNTFCLTRRDHAFISHHIGDLENLETLRSFERGIEHFKRLFNLRPEIIAHDLHPEYISTKYAMALGDEMVKVGVQHHHAHIAGCMADNGVDGQVIGVAMDGLGYGTDGRLWGCEFFVAEYARAERVTHLEYAPMPGGAKAIREPWRMAAIHLQRALGDEAFDLNLDFVKRMDRRAYATLRRMAERGVNSPETSSMGRLFDAVASLAGVRDVARYEGQAAIEFEMAADPSQKSGYEFDCSGKIIKPSPVIRGVVADLLRHVPTPVIAAKFHNAVASLIFQTARRIRAERGLHRVALSGGVFQNRLLLNRAMRLLKADGFEVLTHGRVPPNDGGVSFGQAVVAGALTRADRAGGV